MSQIYNEISLFLANPPLVFIFSALWTALGIKPRENIYIILELASVALPLVLCRVLLECRPLPLILD